MKPCLHTSRGQDGFTLIELLITLLVLGAVTLAVTIVLFAASHSKSTTTSLVEASQGSRVALALVAKDVRSAGYGADLTYPGAAQPSIAYVDSQEIILSENTSPYPDTTNNTPRGPLAYNPAASPRPFPLTVGAYVPPARYRTGAELIRYTLDLNNDGVVNAADLATAAGSDAQATPDPDDYLLVRQVYGDSTNNVGGDNGGSLQGVALVHRPGNGVPALFTVYMRGSSTPWNWANGAVPASQLADIERVSIQITASSGKPDGNGRYQTSRIQQQVNSLRNTPDLGARTYTVDGYVFSDLNHNHFRDGGEPGVPNASVRAGGTYVAYTAASGYYQLHIPAGSYAIRHSPPQGYGLFMSPDSIVVSVPPGTSASFADTAASGGWVNAHAWIDTDGDGFEDPGEPPASGMAVIPTPGTGTNWTDASGNTSLFASTGGYQIAITVPDSMSCSTANPVSGNMTNGGSASVRFGLSPSQTGSVRGKVYRDNNRNGVLDAGETGIQGMWVGVTKDGIQISGYAYTDASGDYSVRTPINDPPHTQAYYVYTVPPAGYYPTSTTAISNLWVQNNAILTGKNFGMAGYQVITLNASRVLSLVSGDMIEKDWNGNQTQNARKDRDLVLGADAAGADNISVWFNDYNNTPLFTPNPDYTRLAPQSVLSMSLDTLDTNSPTARPDLVSGTKKAASGNLFVWLNQNSSGNLGYLPSTYNPSLNYTTQDNGDVQVVLTTDMAGNNMPDIVAGTKSPTSGRGTFEVWTNSGGASPTFSRAEVYPNAGLIPGNAMGEVTAMALADFDGDGDKDLVVGTRTSSYSGELLFFSLATKNNGNRYVCKNVYTLLSDAVTSLAVCDPNGDGRPDVIVGTQSAVNGGNLQHWLNLGSWNFSNIRSVIADGIVMSISAADLGGGTATDVVVGWRQNETSYVGGVRVYYLDLGILPSVGVDVSGGSITNMCPAVCTADFNWGTTPIASPPILTDIAVGVKTGLTTGALVLFIR